MCSALAQETSSEFPYLRLSLRLVKTAVCEVTQVKGTVTTSAAVAKASGFWKLSGN